MKRRDLDELDRLLLEPATAVVAMRDVFEGARDSSIVGLRHDVDDNRGSLDTAVKFAAWEHARGYRSTYYILHTAGYWQHEPQLRAALERIAGLGHEIGIHANAIAAALRTRGDPHTILARAVERLRGFGHEIVGVAPHGDELCRTGDGTLRFVNDEMFDECRRPGVGAPDRTIHVGGVSVTLDPRPLAEFGLVYEAYRIPRGRYLSDSGGRWNVPPASVAAGPGQLHILAHPDWWADAFRGA